MSDSVAEHYMGEVEKRNKRIAELEAERDKLRDVVRKYIVELGKFPRDPQRSTLCFNAMYEAVMEDETQPALKEQTND